VLDIRERSTVRRFEKATVAALLSAALAFATFAAPAWSAVPHVVSPGETLSGIAATDGLSLDGLAAYNGISSDTYLVVGETIQIPAAGETTSSSSTSSSTAASHTVAPGETLSGIAAANGISTDSLAAANGISADTYVIAGQTLAIPSASASTTSTTSTSSAAPVPGLAPIYCPCGTVYLRSDAAAAWTSMRQASLSTYGVDLYPNGPLSAYRSYDQQAELYHLYLTGQGAPADPPGTSSHELGTAVDVATPAMRSVVDSIGSQYGWGKVHGPGEWWHVDYLG
jgi:LysM repeat protein